jgi:acyl carrier protein
MDELVAKTPLQERLAAIWLQLLGTCPAGLQDSFLDAGGDSMDAVGLLNSVNREFHVKVQMGDFFDEPTIAGLAARILEAQARSSAGMESAIADLEQLSDEEAERLLSEDN